MLETNKTSEVRQSSQTVGQSVVVETLMDGALNPVRSTTNAKFHRGSNTCGGSLCHIFVPNRYNIHFANSTRPRNNVEKIDIVLVLHIERKIEVCVLDAQSFQPFGAHGL